VASDAMHIAARKFLKPTKKAFRNYRSKLSRSDKGIIHTYYILKQRVKAHPGSVFLLARLKDYTRLMIQKGLMEQPHHLPPSRRHHVIQAQHQHVHRESKNSHRNEGKHPQPNQRRGKYTAHPPKDKTKTTTFTTTTSS
jgi:hypothetical protein